MTNSLEPTDDREDDDLTYVQVTYLACAQASGEPEDRQGAGCLVTNRRAGFCAFTRRARVRPEPGLYSENLKATGAPRSSQIAAGEGPIRSVSLRTRARSPSVT